MVHVHVHCRLTIATCLILREAHLLIGGVEGACNKYVSGDNGLRIRLFAACGPHPSFSILHLDRWWKLVFNFIFVDADTQRVLHYTRVGELSKACAVYAS